jgi:putative transposase
LAVRPAHCYLCNELCQQHRSKEGAVSRFRKLSHTIWHCQYHVVWVPKYRYRILTGQIKESVQAGIQAICGFCGCEVIELNVQADHVHLVVMVPPKQSISDLLERLKGQSAMRLFHQFRHLKKKPYWGNHFWAKGYCVDTVGLDAEMIRKYVRYQEEKEKSEQLPLIN